MAAADQLQRELALSGPRVAGDQDPEPQHVHAYAVALSRFGERLAEVAAQPVDDLRSRQLGGEHRRARGFGCFQQAHVGGRSVGDHDRGRVDRKELAEHREQIDFPERGEVRDLVVAEDLNAVRMDEVEMAYERCAVGAVAPQPSAAARCSAEPGEPELVAIIVIQLRDADLQHGAARR